MNAKLSNSIVSKLKSIAQKLEPILALGKSGASEAFLKSLDEVLGQHELVKIKFAAFKVAEDPRAPARREDQQPPHHDRRTRRRLLPRAARRGEAQSGGVVRPGSEQLIPIPAGSAG